jgi:acyl carrier protein
VLAARADERRPMLELFLKQGIARSLQLDPGQLDSNACLDTIGLDSLMTIELKQRVESGLGVSLAMTELVHEMTIAGLAGRLAETLAEHPGGPHHSSNGSAAGVASVVSDGEARRVLAQLDQLSDEEVSALLDRMLS